MTEKLIGYHARETLPIQAGDKVRIPKGIEVRCLYRGAYTSGRSHVVTVNHVYTGSGYTYKGVTHTENPSVCWAGTGGYWSQADINDVEKV